MSACPTSLAWAGVGWNTWASAPGPTSALTATRSPPTCLTRSPRMLKLATAWTGGVVCASASVGSRVNEARPMRAVMARRRAACCKAEES